MTKHNIAALSFVLGMHLDRISRLMCARTEGYLDLSREVRFFVAIGHRKYLKGNAEFDLLWAGYGQPCPNDVVVQEWRLDRDLAILEVACGIYTSKGILMKSEVPWDSAEEPESDLVVA